MNEAYERGRRAAEFSRDCWERAASEMRTEKIKIYGTKNGKLYIKPFDLFNLKKVQNLIERATKISFLKG